MENDYYIKKTLTLLVKHGIENKPEEILKTYFSVIDGASGSNVLILDPKETKAVEIKVINKTEDLI
jgi:hypothetical protein